MLCSLYELSTIWSQETRKGKTMLSSPSEHCQKHWRNNSKKTSCKCMLQDLNPWPRGKGGGATLMENKQKLAKCTPQASNPTPWGSKEARQQRKGVAHASHGFRTKGLPLDVPGLSSLRELSATSWCMGAHLDTARKGVERMTRSKGQHNKLALRHQCSAHKVSWALPWCTPRQQHATNASPH